MTTPAWDDAPWPGFAPLAHDLTADACVIGLGGSGLAAMDELLELGRTVVGLDASTVGGGAAGRNGGFLLAGGAPFHHDAVRMWGEAAALAVHRGTLEELDRLAHDAPDLVTRCGSRRIATSAEERADCDAQYRCMVEHGLAVARHEGPDGTGLEFPDDAAFHPLAHCRRTAGRLAMRGAVLHEHSAVTVIEPERVATAHGSVRARHVLVAVDGLLGSLIPALANQVRPVRLQMLATEPTGDIALPCPVYANYGFDYWQQWQDGRIMVGGGRDRFMADAETNVETISDEVQAHLDGLLRDVIGARQVRVTHRWSGIVGYTPDERPIIAEPMPGVWAIGGYSGTGNLVGRRIARGVVQQFVKGSTTLLEGFRP
ncbi:MAG TPA: FAD-dependent oxidoreductase [Gemmatimonadales bacterium]|nr:FAD-dependent oxidoreductase [Gemmatimonadales bacterium]